MTAGAIAISMVGAAGPSFVRSAGDGGRRDKGMPSQRLACSAHLFHVTAGTQRRHRIVAFTRAFEDVSTLVLFAADISRLARYSDLVFNMVVIRFEVLITQRQKGRAWKH